MAETAVVVLLPELEPLIGEWRRRYTRDGSRGMPPHVTLMVPFADSSGLDSWRDALGRVVGEFRQFEVTLSRTARFAGLLYLRPEPEEPFVALTEALVEAFPAFLPYGGEFEGSSRTPPSLRGMRSSWPASRRISSRGCR